MRDGTLRIATCQFGVTGSVAQNARAIRGFLKKAKKAKADVVHFSECALSGYAGADFDSFEDYDWAVLKEETQRIMELAGELGLWVVLGSTHPLTPPHKPHNCLYLIDARGRIVTRYDKRFCTSRRPGLLHARQPLHHVRSQRRQVLPADLLRSAFPGVVSRAIQAGRPVPVSVVLQRPAARSQRSHADHAPDDAVPRRDEPLLGEHDQLERLLLALPVLLHPAGRRDRRPASPQPAGPDGQHGGLGPGLLRSDGRLSRTGRRRQPHQRPRRPRRSALQGRDGSYDASKGESSVAVVRHLRRGQDRFQHVWPSRQQP